MKIEKIEIILATARATLVFESEKEAKEHCEQEEDYRFSPQRIGCVVLEWFVVKENNYIEGFKKIKKYLENEKKCTVLNFFVEMIKTRINDDIIIEKNMLTQISRNFFTEK